MASKAQTPVPAIIILVPAGYTSYIIRVIPVLALRSWRQSSILPDIRALSYERPAPDVGFLLQVRRCFVMRKLVFGRAQVLFIDMVESQSVVARYVFNVEKDELISALLQHQGTELSAPESQNLQAYLLSGVQMNGEAGLRVWCFFYRVDGVAVSLWLLIALCISCACGVGVGYGKHDSQLGWSVGTGLLAILTMVNGLVLVFTA